MLADLQLAIRMLRRSPSFLLTAVLTLAIGIGGTTTIFTIVDALLLRPLPFRSPDQLVYIAEVNPDHGREPIGVSVPNLFDWQQRAATFEDFSFFGRDDVPTVLATPGGPLQVSNVDVLPNFFRLLGVTPLLGPGFAHDASAQGKREVVLSHNLWQSAFAGDPQIIGKGMRIEARDAFTIVGIMPRGFVFPRGVDLWVAAPTDDYPPQARGNRFVNGIGRMRRATSLEAARSELETISTQLAMEHPRVNSGWTVTVTPLRDTVVRDYRVSVLTLFAAVGLVLLVGCSNVANLVLARGVARQRELAVRAAIGASRQRLIRQLLVETLVMAITGGIVGWLIASVAIPVITSVASGSLPGITDARLGLAAFTFCAVVSMVATLLVGAVPALRVSGVDLRSSTDADGERSSSVGAEWPLQRLLITAQLAISLTLVIGALLLIQSFVRLRSVDPGFSAAHVISMSARVPLYRFPEGMGIRSRYRLEQEARAVLTELRRIPGVQSAATINDPPLSGNSINSTVRLASGESRTTRYHQVSADYFRTIGIALQRGRDFHDRDAITEEQFTNLRANRRDGAAIVNETAARLFWPDAEALGQSLSTDMDWAVRRRQVVGVVADAHYDSLRVSPGAEVYVSFLEDPSFAMTLLVRTELPLERVLPTLRDAIHGVDPEVSVANVRMLDDLVSDATRSSQLSTLIIGGFATVAVLLSAVGIYGVLTFAIARRRREVGIRMALGANPSDIRRLMLGGAAGAIASGLVAGIAGAIAVTRLMSTLLFDVTPTDPTSFGAGILLLLIVAIAASYLPVRRAIRTEPAIALRR